MALFDRVADLVVGQSGGTGILVQDLRFEFVVEKSASETLNSSTVRIYNLSPASRKLVERPNNAVIVKAGYRQDIGPVTIFVGIVRRALTTRENTDWVTELELDDGLIAYQGSKTSRLFPSGVAGIDVLKGVSSQFGLPVRPLPPDISKKTYPTGFSTCGRTREAMAKVCDYLGLEWSIQNQEIQIVKKGGVVKQSAVVLSAETGLIGSPALEARTMTDKQAAKSGISTSQSGVIVKGTKVGSGGNTNTRLEVQGYKVVSLLQPRIEPGGYVQLKAVGIDGFFRVEAVTHKGDTGGQEWTSEVSLRFI